MRYLLALISIPLFMLSACGICDNLSCLNGGQCSLGVCDCPEGFGGEFCEKELICETGVLECQNGSVCKGSWCACKDFFMGDSCERVYGDKFIGEYSGSADCFGEYSYLSCPDSLEPNEMWVSHVVWDYREYFGFTIQFENDSSGIFEIPTQRYYLYYFSSEQDSVTVSGNGYFSDSSMIYTLTLDYDNLNDRDRECFYDLRLSQRIDITKQ